MKLQRINANKPDFEKLNTMLDAMKGMLENTNTSLTFEELLSFQDTDGSFKLLDSYEVPGDARVDFCHTPTYIGAAVLMREFLAGRKNLPAALEGALKASLNAGLNGHGYDSEEGRIHAMNIFIKGGLQEFLETQGEICPEFHQMIHNILHEYNSCLLQERTEGPWGENYSADWMNIVKELKLSKRLYAAYGSNMDTSQMTRRCPGAIVLGKAYLEDWELTMPFYADIEPASGAKTPALLWEITPDDEKSLDRHEGYPKLYDKTEVIVELEGKRMSALAYAMTDEYKKTDKQPRKGYVEQILRGYCDAGFNEEEFKTKSMAIAL